MPSNVENDVKGMVSILTIAGRSLTAQIPLHKEADLKLIVDELEMHLVSEDLESILNLFVGCDPELKILLTGVLKANYTSDLVNLVVNLVLTELHNQKKVTDRQFLKHIGRIDAIIPGLVMSIVSFKEDCKNHYYEVLTPRLNNLLVNNGKDEMHGYYKSLAIDDFFYICTKLIPDAFKLYLGSCAQELISSNKEVSWNSLWTTAIPFLYTNKNFKPSSEYYSFFMDEVTRLRKCQRDVVQNKKVNMSSDLWVIPYRDVEAIRTLTLDFSDLEPPIKNEVKSYLSSWMEKGEIPKAISRRFHGIMRLVIHLQSVVSSDISFLDMTYVDVLSVLDSLQLARKENGQMKYGLKTIQGTISEARIMFDWLKTVTKQEDLLNPFRRLKLHNTSSFIHGAEYIPEEVVEKISSFLHECPPHIQRAWIIMMNTGMRISEVLHLDESCLEYNAKESTYYIRFIPHKTLRQRRKKGLGDFHYIPLVHDDVVSALKAQLSLTEELRNKGKTAYIFIRESGSNRLSGETTGIGRHLGPSISQSINKCIRRHNICDHDGHLWRFSNHQCRKTLAVKLLDGGASISQVGEILGHLEEKTTRQYYEDVDARKLALLDKELFDELFDNIEDEVRKSYSPQDIEQIKREILLGSRETPEGHGHCIKHVSFGPCRKHRCVGCNLLLTGPQKLNMWRTLYQQQQGYIEELRKQIIADGHAGYASFRDYQAEVNLLELYKNTINRIEEFMEGRGVKV